MHEESDHDIQYDEIMSAAGQGVAASRYKDGKWILEYVNPALCNLLCRPANYLVGKSIDDFILQDDLPKLMDARKKRLAGETTSYEVRLVRSGRDAIYAQMTGAPRWLDGKVVGSILIITDLTERKRTEELLQESENKYRAIFENTGTVMIIIEDDTTISLVNAEFERVTGYTKEEVEGKKSWTEFIVKEDLEKMLVQHRIRRIDPDAALKSYEFRLVDKSGNIKNMLLTVDVISGSKKTVASLMDITERRQIEVALKTEKEKAERYLNIAEVILVALDTQAGITLLNRKGYQVLGYEEGELIGKNWIETCLRPHDHKRVHEVNRKINASELKAFEYYENYVITKNGDERIIAWHTTTVRDDDGHIIGTLSSGEDITERKQAEDALEYSETKYRMLFENSPVGTISANLDGSIIEVNQALVEVMGSPSAEATKQINIFNFPPLVDAGVSVSFKRCIESGEPIFYEHPYISKWGKPIHLRLRLNPIRNAKGVITGAQGTVEDTSEQKLAEEKLIASLHEKEVLLKEIHHRVKNNLQIISSLLSVQAHYSEDERVSDVLGECRNRVKSMALIHENLYRSESLARVDFARYISDLTKSLVSSFGVDRRLIKLNLNLDQIFLSIDKGIPCGLIVNELVSNCLKHAFSGQRTGDVWVELHSLDNDNLLLIVKDNGIGFTKSLEPHKAKTLGLRLITDLIKQIKGDIQIDHSGGTEFKIVIPMSNGRRRTPLQAAGIQ
jgi:PAS domain S-box-containing protein